MVEQQLPVEMKRNITLFFHNISDLGLFLQVGLVSRHGYCWTTELVGSQTNL